MVAAIALTGADDNTIEKPKVIMGHPGLRAPGTVSLSEAMGTTHFVLNQAQDVLYWEREDINEERLHLSVWVSLLM
jgi:G:T/U-mismatch repair DNA glycosylase